MPIPRLTRERLCKSVQSIRRRITDLRKMNDVEFAAERERIGKALGLGLQGSDRDVALWLAQDALDRAIPDQWIH